MDKVTRAEEQRFVSGLTNVRQFFEKVLPLSSAAYCYDSEDLEADLARQIGCSEEVLAEIAETASGYVYVFL